MTDLYLLLTPVVALLVLALARFVGCGGDPFTSSGDPRQPLEKAFVYSRDLGDPRTNFTGWVGMVIHVGAKELTVTQLGRIMLTASTAEHQVKLVEPAGMGGGADLGMPVTIPIGTTSDPDSLGFAYAPLQPAVVLSANTDYYVVSHEAAMGDVFHDVETTTVTTTEVAAVTSGVFYDDGMPGPGYQPAGGSKNTYGPVDFKYEEPATE